MAKRPDRRIEPSFDGPKRGLSVSEADRVLPSRGRAKGKAKGAKARGKGRGGARRRGLLGGFGRLFYWTFVLAIWAGIGVTGMVVYYGAKMPASTTWSIPDRSPNIKIVAVD